ncbi:MAG: carboxypeptidase-like regulatory domain-containing protein [Pirellulales bacterium]
MNKHSMSGWMIVAMAALLATGCGRHAAKVSGQVTLEGRPLTNGVVSFTPMKPGSSAYGTIGAEGRYSLQTGAEKGLDPGDYKVTVAANATPEEAAQMGFKVGREGIMPLLTPLRYADGATTPLSATVKPGAQVIDLMLERAP